MLNLLFNYKGIISHREFRAGIVILFLLIVLEFISLAIYRSFNIAILQIGFDQQSSYTEFINTIANFIPSLIPGSFLFSYTAFVLSLKRMRALSEKRFTGVFSGILNYLFFASISSLLLLSRTLFFEYSIYHNNRLFLTPPLISIIVLLFVFGLINVIICAKANRNSEKTKSSSDRLDPISYLIKLGNILGIATIFIFLLIGLTIIFPDLLTDPSLTTILLRIALLITLFFYITYTFRRVKDANVPVAVFISVIGAYVALIATKHWMISTNHSLLYLFSPLFSAATNLLVAAQFLLFLLPSKNKESMS